MTKLSHTMQQGQTMADRDVATKGRPEERTLQDQVRGILREALESPDLPEHTRATLRALLLVHGHRPEQALLEHLRLIRNPDRADSGILAAAGSGHLFSTLPQPMTLPVPAIAPAH
ncbi:hypothetical protein [Sinomonas atrocyanea]